MPADVARRVNTRGKKNQSGLSDLPATLTFMEYQQVTDLVASMRLDPYCSLAPRFLGVVDANAILSSVDNDCRKGPHWRSRLLRMASGGTAVLYAPDHVYGEVYRRMPKIARSSPVPLAVLRERFEAEYASPAVRHSRYRGDCRPAGAGDHRP